MGGFAQRLGFEHRLRQRQRACGVAGGLELIDAGFAFALCAGALAGAAPGQPAFDLGAVGQGQVAEQGRGVGQVMLHTANESQHGAAVHQLNADLLAQPEQPLAQGVARGFGAAVGPEQRGQAFARGRALQREPGQQQRVGRGQGVGAAACFERWRRAELEPCGAGCCRCAHADQRHITPVLAACQKRAR